MSTAFLVPRANSGKLAMPSAHTHARTPGNEWPWAVKPEQQKRTLCQFDKGTCLMDSDGNCVKCGWVSRNCLW